MGARFLLALVALLAVACTAGPRKYVPFGGVPERSEEQGTRDPGLEAAVQRLGWRSFVEGGDEAAAQPRFIPTLAPFSAEKITLSRAIAATNPDPKWLQQWGREDSLQALAQAIINRSWGEDCRADYHDYLKRWTAVGDAYAPKIAAAVALDRYAAVEALVRLHNEMLVEADDLYLRRDRWTQLPTSEHVTPIHHPLAFRGPPFAIAKAIVDVLQRDNQLEYGIEVLGRLHDAHGFVVGPFYNKLGQPLEPGVRDLFCNAAVRTGTHRIPPLPRVPGLTERAVYWDQWGESGPYDPDKLKRGFPLPGLGVATEPLHPPLAPSELVKAVLALGTYVRFGAHHVLAVEQLKDGAVRVTLSEESRRSYARRLVGTDRLIEAEDRAGTRLIVTFAALPPSIEIRVGDVLGVDGTPRLVFPPVVVEGTRGRVERRVIHAHGQHIRTLVRGEQLLIGIGP